MHAFPLELGEEAEQLGAHSVWVTEHHQFDDGHLGSPLSFGVSELFLL
ncbi:LLM class flavin-dependent oxidoreductase [Mycobacterium paraseoulense]|nr:LLM class flavin-dependent oxidoreductase [Mycobacterium paraseoulense]MCV7393991.1 hypothetical protein [Mycobacterium paraseoulense]